MLIRLVLLVACLLPTAYAAPSVWVYDTELQRVIYKENSSDTRSIASITKLMTAMVTLDHNGSLNNRLQMRTRLSKLPKHRYTRRDLIKAMLINSDNGAAETLAEDYPGGKSAFVRAMNYRAVQLGLAHTKFQDPHGLGIGNVSTAEEVGVLIQAAARYPFIQSVSSLPSTTVQFYTHKRTGLVDIDHTNKVLLKEFNNIVVSKTGYTNMAGWCIAIITEQQNHKHIIVVLGEKNKKARAKKIKEIMQRHVMLKLRPVESAKE